MPSSIYDRSWNIAYFEDNFNRGWEIKASVLEQVFAMPGLPVGFACTIRYLQKSAVDTRKIVLNSTFRLDAVEDSPPSESIFQYKSPLDSKVLIWHLSP